MRKFNSVLILLLGYITSINCFSEDNYIVLTVTEPFVELRHGPAYSYSAFFIAQKNQQLTVLKRKNNWFKVYLRDSIHREKTGWLHINDILTMKVNKNNDEETILAKNHPLLIAVTTSNYYLGVHYGQITDGDIIGTFGGYHFTEVLRTELQLSNLITGFTEANLGSINFQLAPVGDIAKIEPWFAIGYGFYDSQARGTASQQNEGTENLFQLSGGFNVSFSKRFKPRIEYRNYKILQSNSINLEIDSWHLGFLAYF